MIGALVLAAGASSRMGSPKALLDLHGETALERVVRAARAAADDVVVVLGHDAERILARTRPDGARVVRNPTPEAGRTGSIHAGLATLGAADAFFIHPVDVPLVTGADFRALREAWTARDAGASVFVATHARRGGHPLLVDASRRADLLGLGPDTPLRALLDARPDAVRRVPVPNPGVLMNLNTPEDYQRALALDRRPPHAAGAPA